MKTRTFSPSILALAVLAGLLLTSCAGILPGPAQPTATPAPVTNASGTVTAEGHIVPRDFTTLSFAAGGTLAEVKVKNGDVVKKGAVLVSLGDRESYQAALTAAELELANAQRASDDLNKNASLATYQAAYAVTTALHDLVTAQKALAVLDTKEYATKIDDARKTANTARDDLKTAQDDFDKVKDMDPANSTYKTAADKLKDAQNTYAKAAADRDLLINDLDQAAALVNLAKSRLDDAERTQSDRKAGPDPADLTLVNARLANARAQQAAAQAALDRLDLTAPYDGTVVKVEFSVGEKAQPGQAVVTFADLSQWYVETSDLTEKDVVSIQVGQTATIVPDALPNLTLAGTVESIAQNFVEKSGDINYTVRLPLDRSDPLLRWGMTVKVTFAQK